MNQNISPVSLREHIFKAMEEYFIDTKQVLPQNIYQLVLGEVEPPLLEMTLKYTQGNQSEAAKVLGLNRATLRKKLIEHGLLKSA